MSGINTGKVITGGLVAGIVMNVLDFAGNYVMRADFMANTTRLGLDPASMESTSAIATWVVIDLLMGITIIFAYAAIRPRFGAGPKTATIAALVMWFGVGLILFGMASMGMLDMPLFWKATAISLVNLIVSANAGAALYKEA
jgi:hypothetical protein